MVMRNSSKNTRRAYAWPLQVFEESTYDIVSSFRPGVQFSQYPQKGRTYSGLCSLCPYREQCNSLNPKIGDLFSRSSKGGGCMVVAVFQEIVRLTITLGFLSYLIGGF
jgi:hypothetical protein